MIHNEHLTMADELYEIRHDNNGNAIHVYIKNGNAKVFPTLDDLVRYVYYAVNDIEYFNISEQDLENLYSRDEYGYYELKSIYKQ